MSIIEKALNKAQSEREQMVGDSTLFPQMLEESQFKLSPSRRDHFTKGNILMLTFFSILIATTTFVIGDKIFTNQELEEEYNIAIEKVNKIDSAKEALSLSSDSTDLNEVQEQPALTSSRSFIAAGWDKLEQDNFEAAEKIWRPGLESMSKDQTINVITVYLQKEGMLRRLKMFNRASYVFALTGRYQNRRAYYLLAAPPADKSAEITENIKKVLNFNRLEQQKVSRLLAFLDSSSIPKESSVASLSPTPTPTPSVADDRTVRANIVSRKEDLLANAGKTDLEAILVGRSLIRLGEYNSAISKLEPLFRKHPSNWELCLVLGLAYIGAGNLQKATDYLNWGLSVDKSQPALWLELGLIAQQTDEHGKALLYFMEAKRLSPESPQVWLNIGYSNEMLGKYFEASDAYQKFINYSAGDKLYTATSQEAQKRLTIINNKLQLNQ
ncbi:MAG: tetratricopeptide repeat protein [Nitrospinota bacterium]